MSTLEVFSYMVVSWTCGTSFFQEVVIFCSLSVWQCCGLSVFVCRFFINFISAACLTWTDLSPQQQWWKLFFLVWCDELNRKKILDNCLVEKFLQDTFYLLSFFHYFWPCCGNFQDSFWAIHLFMISPICCDLWFRCIINTSIYSWLNCVVSVVLL